MDLEKIMQQTKLEQKGKKPTWTPDQEIKWSDKWNPLFQRFLDSTENTDQYKQLEQELLDLKFENKLWVFNQMSELEKINHSLTKLLQNVVKEQKETKKQF